MSDGRKRERAIEEIRDSFYVHHSDRIRARARAAILELHDRLRKIEAAMQDAAALEASRKGCSPELLAALEAARVTAATQNNPAALKNGGEAKER